MSTTPLSHTSDDASPDALDVDEPREEDELWPYPLPRYSVWAPAPDVLALVTHSVFSAEHEERLPDGPALVLVHDEGLYLVGNGWPSLPPLPAASGSQRAVHLRAPRGRVLDSWEPSNRYAGTGNDFAVAWPLTAADPARIAAVGPEGRVVVSWSVRGPEWTPVAATRRAGAAARDD